MVLSVCRNVLHDLHDAEDAFQAVFLLLSQKAGSLHRREAVSGWLYRVAYRLAVRARAKAARRKILEKRVLAMPSADPVLDMRLREVRTILFEELDGLPEQYRAPLVLCSLEEKSLEEAARLLGWTKGTTKGRLQRGRELLRLRLRRRGLELPAALSATALALNSASSPVSATLASSTLQAAVKLAAGHALAAGVVSANVAALIQGASKTMFLTKAKMAIALLVAGGIAASAVGMARLQAPAADEPTAQTSQAEKPNLQATPPLPGTQTMPASEATITVRGQVLDPDGRPVAGAKLYLRRSTADGPVLSQQATSGMDGRFRVVVSKPELDRHSARGSPMQIMAAAQDYGCDWEQIGQTEAEMTLHLVKDVPINGHILDPEGRPVAAAKITVAAVLTVKGDDLAAYLEQVRLNLGNAIAKRWTGPLAGRPDAVMTDRDGRFCLTGVGRDRLVQLRVEGPAIVSMNLGIVMTRATETISRPGGIPIYGASFDYVAFASRSIRGVVRDQATGKPLAGVSVGNAHGPNWPKPTITDNDGRYEILGLPKSPRYWLLAKPADGLHFQREVEVQETPGLGALPCDIELVNGLMVHGRVTDKETGQPIAAARVDYHPLGGNPHVGKLPGAWNPGAETITGPDGGYTLTVLPGPGAMGVTASRPDAYMPACVTVQERKDFFKAPLANNDNEDHLTRAVGSNHFSGISLGHYNAIVLLEPGENEEALVKDIALGRPQERKGRVLGPDGKPLTGVTATGLAPFGLGLHGIETLKEAEFTVRGINPRARRPLVFYHKDKNLGCFLNELPRDSSVPLTVQLQPCGSTSGRIVDPDGQPVAGLHLGIQSCALRVTGEQGGGYHDVTTDKDGRFHVGGLVPGQEYRVSEAHTPDGYLRIYALVRVEPGKQHDMGEIKMKQRSK